jgi:vacuolar-type H+-ATPase subunit I/STV1
MSDEDDPLKDVKALLTDMEKSSDDVILTVARTETAPLASRLTMPRQVRQLAYLVKNLIIIARSQAEIDETLLKAIFSLKSKVDKLPRTPSEKEVQELKEEVGQVRDDVETVVKPLKAEIDRAKKEFEGQKQEEPQPPPKDGVYG